MLRKPILISAGLLFLLFLVPELAFCAAATTSFGGRRSLLALRDMHASVYLEYNFDRSHTKAKSDTRFYSHEFTEELTIGGYYSLYKPEFWRGIYKVTFGGDQNSNYRNGESSGRNNNTHQKYEFYGDLFYLSNTPVSIKSILRDNQVKRKFATNYNLWTESHLISLKIKNRNLPTQISYNRSENETSGLAINRISDVQSMSLSMSHNLNEIMATSLSYTRTQHSAKVIELGTQSSNDRAVASVTNSLKWLRGRGNIGLYSTYRFSEFSGEDVGYERYWEEELSWKPGRALRIDLVHIDRQKDENDVGVGEVSNRGSLTYYLYHSLSMSMFLSQMDRTFLNGEQNTDAATFRVTYKKDLNSGKRFTLNVEQGFEDLTREVATNNQSVLGESLTIDLTALNFLGNSNVVIGSVLVRDDTGAVIYIEGLDYALNVFGNLTEIEILPGSAISDGDQLSINYSFVVNPSIAYTTDRTFISSILSFYNGSLRLTGRFTTSNRQRTSGSDDFVSLNDVQIYSLGVVGRFKPHRFNMSYTDTVTNDYTLKQLEASYGYETVVAGGGLLLDVGDVYQVYRGDVENSANRLSSRAIYRYRISRTTLLKTEAEGLIATGDSVDRKMFNLKFDVNIRLRKTIYSASLEEEYLDYESRSAWNETIMLSMRRTF